MIVIVAAAFARSMADPNTGEVYLRLLVDSFLRGYWIILFAGVAFFGFFYVKRRYEIWVYLLVGILPGVAPNIIGNALRSITSANGESAAGDTSLILTVWAIFGTLGAISGLLFWFLAVWRNLRFAAAKIDTAVF